MRQSTLEELLAESEAEERRNPVLGRVHLVLPFVILVAALVLLSLSGDLRRYALAAAGSIISMGKIIVVFGGLPEKTRASLGIPEMSVVELGLMVFAMDVWVAYLLAYNLHHVYRIRTFRLGDRLHKLHRYCRFWLDTRPWMRRWAFTGVLLFVMFPITGTGAIGGSILGRLGGLRARATVLAIAMGSALGCTLMAAFATPLEPIFERIQDEWWFNALGIGVFLAVMVLLLWIGRRMSLAADRHAEEMAQGGNG